MIVNRCRICENYEAGTAQRQDEFGELENSGHR